MTRVNVDPSRRKRIALALITGTVVGCGSVFVGALPASAHVKVSSDNRAAGAYAKLTFRVPNESDKASTNKIVVTLPAEYPMTSVRLKPKTGWIGTAAKSTLPKPITTAEATITKAVTTITWTAQPGVGIAPDQFDEFEVSAGPLPDKAGVTLTMPAAQHYTDNTVVNWNEPMPAGGAEPKHPAPSLVTGPAEAGGEHGHGTESAAEPAPPAGMDGLARGLGTAGLVFGLVGMCAAAWAYLRRPAGKP